MKTKRLGIGIIGSGFNAQFHLRAFQQVRDCDVLGIWSPNARNAASTARMARELDVGDAVAYKSIAAMVGNPDIHAIWLCGPNHARIDNVEEIVHTVERGRGELVGLACEKPLARNVAEAREVAALARRCGSRPATWRTSCLRRRSRWERRCSGRVARGSRDDPISRARRRSTAGRTHPGSGAASCRVAASSMT